MKIHSTWPDRTAGGLLGNGAGITRGQEAGIRKKLLCERGSEKERGDNQTMMPMTVDSECKACGQGDDKFR